MSQVTVNQIPSKHSDNLSNASTDHGQCIKFTGAPFENQRNIAKNSKAKTSLCRNFMEKGYCSYGDKCQFAHGPSELKCNSDRLMSYKTRPCHSFNQKAFCVYGQRCNFLHFSELEEKGTNASYMDSYRQIVYGGRLTSILEPKQ